MFLEKIIDLLALAVVLTLLDQKVNAAASFRDDWFKNAINSEDIEFLKAPLKPSNDLKQQTNSNIKVGIVGAGISGLYAALLLDSFNISFELHEANSEHLGGRAFTYHFNKNYKNAKTCAEYYDYGEVGPMRIPRKIIRLAGDEKWSLVNYLNSLKSVEPKVKLIPFYYSNDNTLYYYNGRKIFYSNDQVNDPLGFGDTANGGKGMGVPDSYSNRPFWQWTDYVVQPFLTIMDTNITKAYEFLKKYDNNSVRSFMATFDAKDLLREMGLNFNYTSPVDSITGERLDRTYPQIVVDWTESLDTGTGMYDNAMAETVIDAFDFTSNDWVTIDGGVSRLIDGLSDALSLDFPPRFPILNAFFGVIIKT